MAQNEIGHYSEATRPAASVEMLCGDKWVVVQIYTDHVPSDELRRICLFYARRNPGVEYRFRHGIIHFAEEFEIVKTEG